jgi:CHAD domain-containing protein
VAFALVERDRRALAGRRRRAHRFGLFEDEDLHAGLRRMALGQLDLAIGLLREAHEADAEQAMHEIRKAIKRLRALMRVLRDQMGEQAYRRENAALREAGRHLAGARDAQVTLSTLELLLEDLPRKRTRRRTVKELRDRFRSERDRAVAEAFRHAGPRQQALGRLLGVRARVAGWPSPWQAPTRALGRGPGASKLKQMGTVGGGLESIYQQGRKRLESAHASKRPAALHELRKRVKDLRYAAEMLTPENGQAKRIRRLAKSADRIGEVLGEEHDLVILIEHLGGHDDLLAGDLKTRKLLLKAIDRRRKRLRKQALRMGDHLYEARRPPI